MQRQQRRGLAAAAAATSIDAATVAFAMGRTATARGCNTGNVADLAAAAADSSTDAATAAPAMEGTAVDIAILAAAMGRTVDARGGTAANTATLTTPVATTATTAAVRVATAVTYRRCHKRVHRCHNGAHRSCKGMHYRQRRCARSRRRNWYRRCRNGLHCCCKLVRLSIANNQVFGDISWAALTVGIVTAAGTVAAADATAVERISPDNVDVAYRPTDYAHAQRTTETLGGWLHEALREFGQNGWKPILERE